MRTLAIGLALACAAAFVSTTPADAKCYWPKAIPITKTPMSKLPPPQACFIGHIEQIKGVAYCVSCGLKGIEVAPNKCVASCKPDYLFNSVTKQCCPGKAPPPPIIR